ncbi:MAG: adenylate/guanylate cyclase domain-containing protein [Geminicoccaceae bacterium]|nr:adenylate/guanylate cyclase domain-containing protein [Geminicoccaceae bacterium]
MSAVPDLWPQIRLRTLAWLAQHSRRERFLEDLLARMSEHLVLDGIPIARSTLQLRTLHPQFAGARLLWRPGMTRAEVQLFEHEALALPAFRHSPVRALFEGAEAIRQRLDIPAPVPAEFPIYAELRAEGMTDYLAMPMTFTDGTRHAVTWATRRAGGFSGEDIRALAELLPILAMAVEIRLNRRIARTLLDTYVGRHAGERILAGEIRRGSGTTVRAAIWQCDLRGFTGFAEREPRDAVIDLLNRFFEAAATPIEAKGGEILKFMGDGVLAIFPLEEDAACARALEAAIEARRAMRSLNRQRHEAGREALRFGLALHVGDVMYGNIGTATRLDFTVIGPAVNVAARLQELAKELDREVLLSAGFAALCSCAAGWFEPLGRFPLRGVSEPVDVFALAEVV